MAKDQDKTEDVDKDSFTDEDESAKTSAETVNSKRSSAPPRAEAASESKDEPADDESKDEPADDESKDEPADDESSDDESSDDEDEPEAPKAAKPARSAPPAESAYRTAAAAGHDDDHGFAHVVSLQLLAGVLGALLVLTVLTVAVTRVNLGGEMNLVVAMLIATIKGALVVTFFMHLLWDKKFNLLVFLTGVLFVILFIGLSLTDRKEYQHLIDQREALTNQEAK